VHALGTFVSTVHEHDVTSKKASTEAEVKEEAAAVQT